MCESNKNNGESGGKSSLLTPLLSQVPKGVSKVFILTPEILRNLGLTGQLDIKKTNQEEPKSINISTLNLQQLPGAGDHEANSMLVKTVPEATSSTSAMKKRKRDSISEKNSHKTFKASKTSIENSTQLEQRKNETKPEISDNLNYQKESICCTPKRKKLRRRSNAVEKQREESTNKSAENKSKTKSEPILSDVRSSKRVVKPKKFDDYVMTDIFLTKSRTGETINDTPISAKRQSRKSSGNSSKAEMPKSREKTETEEIDKFKETKSNKTELVMDQRSTTTRKSLSNDEIFCTPPETIFNVDKSKAVRTYVRRNSRDQMTPKFVADDKTVSKKLTEPVRQESSRTLTSHNDRKMFLPVHQGKSNVNNVKTIRTYQKPKVSDKIIPETVQLADKKESKKELETETSLQEISKSEIISSTREICVNKREKQINVKPVKSYEKPKAKENIAKEIVQPEEIRRLMEKCEPASSKSDECEKQKIVSSMEIRKIKSVESKCIEKSREMELQMNSPKSTEKKEEFKAPEPKLTNLRLKGRIVTISRSKLTKFLGPPSVLKSLSPIFRSKDESSVAKSHLPRSPDEKEEFEFSKTILPSSEDKNEIGTSQTDPMRSRENKMEASISATILSSALAESQAGGSNIIMPMSRDDDKKFNISKTISPECQTKKEIVSKVDTTMSVDETTASCSKADKPKLWIKKRIGAVKPNIPKKLNKKKIGALTPEVSTSVDKDEIETSIPKASIFADKQEGETLIPEVPISADIEELKTSIAEVLMSSDVKKVAATIPEVSISLDKKGTNASIPEASIFPDKEETKGSKSQVTMFRDIKKTTALLPEVPKFPYKNEANTAIPEVSKSSDKIELNASIPEVSKSSVKNKIDSSTPKVPKSSDKNEANASIPEVSKSSDKNEGNASIPEVPKSSDTNEAKASIPEVPISFVKIGIRTSVPEVTISLAKNDVRTSIPEVPVSFLKKKGTSVKLEFPKFPGKKETNASILEAPISPNKTGHKIPNLLENYAKNATDILNVNSTTGILLTSPTSSNVEEEIVLTNFSRTGDYIAEELDEEKKKPSKEVRDKISKYRVPRKKGERRSRKPQILIEASEEYGNAEVENAAASHFDTFVKSTCRTQKSTKKFKNDTNVKNLNEAKSEKHKNLFASSPNIPIIFDAADNPPNIPGSDSSTKIQSASLSNLVVDIKTVLENFPTGEESIIEEMEVENSVPVQDPPKGISEYRVPRKKEKIKSRKPRISIESSEDHKKNVEVKNAFPTAASSFDSFVDRTCPSKKSTQKSKIETDAKNLTDAESKKHKILFKPSDEEDKGHIGIIFDAADNPPDIPDSDSSTKIQSTSLSNLVVEEKIVLGYSPTGKKSAIEEMEVENSIPVQTLPKKVPEVRVSRKKEKIKSKKPPISIGIPEDQERDQQGKNPFPQKVISTAANSFDTFVQSPCRTKKFTKKREKVIEVKGQIKVESEKRKVLFKLPNEEDKYSIPNILNDTDDPPDIPERDLSTKNAFMSSQNLVVTEKIVTDNFPTGEASVMEVKEAENCIPVEDAPKESEIRAPRKKGRPRKTRIVMENPVDQETDQPAENLISPTTNTFDTFVESSSRTKKPAQRSKDEIDGKGLSGDSEAEFENDEIVLKRGRGRPGGSTSRGKRGQRARGRGRGKTRQRVDFEYVPREKSPGKKQPNAAESTEVNNSQELDLTEVECGKCKEKITKSQWSIHNLSKHNDMGWRNGEQEPDFSDEKFLRSVLMAALKKKKKKNPLTCETCGVGKRSANGFISHLQFCGKSEEERQLLLLTCPICGNVMMPSSMEMHERFHRQMDAAIVEQEKNASTTSGREKRKAAEKAATKISEFTDLVKDEVAPSKKKRREDVMKLIEKPRYMKGTPNRWRGIWKSEINTKGTASCRQPGCKFIGDSIETLCNHNIICPCTPRQNFVCKICQFSSENEKEVIKHVKAKHDGGSSGQPDDSDFEGEESTSSSDSGSHHSDDTTPKSSVSVQKIVHEKRQRPKTNVKFLDDLSHIDPKWHTSYSPAILWTMEFERQNYRLSLFKNLKPNAMNLLNDEDAVGYLPELSCSMRMKEAKKRTDDKPPEWVNWKRFEGRGADGVLTFFTGGPIWALAWLPIPAPLYDHSVAQYVAVSTHPTMESVYIVGKSYIGKNLIQIWNVGHLEHNKTTDHVVPTLSYGVAHDKGTIWCLEWCPSGCYEHSSFLEEKEAADEKEGRKRMGLLAAACSDGCVHVFSLPFPDELNLAKNDQATNSSLPIYETKPVLTLIASTAMYEKGEQNWQCTKLNWGKELGHDTIIAGFSNGYVAMWDLNSESPLFVTRSGETTLIDAFYHFYAHSHAVSFVQMVPYGDKRFFITSGYDRLSKVWDLEDTSYPLSITKRGIALDGAWLNHWPGYLTAYDDVMVHGHTYLMSLRQPGHKIFALLPNNSPTFSVDVSDYGNSIGHGTLAGEVLVMFPHHLWNHRDMERDVPRKRWLASSSEVVDIAATGSGKEKNINSCLKRKIGKDYVYMPETYEECKNRFGIIFRDDLSRSKRDGHRKQSRPPCSERLSAVQIEQYPFASANRVSWNPNAWSYLWLCVGYQNGLVRFLNFNSVAVDRELRKLLPSHAESMLDESRRSLIFENDPVNYDSSHTSETR